MSTFTKYLAGFAAFVILALVAAWAFAAGGSEHVVVDHDHITKPKQWTFNDAGAGQVPNRVTVTDQQLSAAQAAAGQPNLVGAVVWIVDLNEDGDTEDPGDEAAFVRWN